MRIFADVFRTVPSSVEGPDASSSPPSGLSSEEPDWRSLFEHERARAQAAQARSQELRWAEVRSRHAASCWKSRFTRCRKRLTAALEESKEVRRAAKDTLSLQAEVARVTALLSQAGVDARKRSTMVSLRTEVGRLSADLKASQAEKEALASRVEVLEAELATLRASKATLSKSLFGRKSEQQDKTRSGRRRGQQRDAARHGRTQRPALAEKSEEHHPAHDARLCACCGKPYVANGAHESKMVEVHVEAHTRVIRRPRWRRSCTCASSPREVSAPPAARLFANTSYGVSVWARFLFERYACLRPLNRVAAWLCDQGLAVSAGTLGDSVRRFVALFEPLAEAILAHQNEARLRHGDETGWRIQSLGEQGRSSRAWLWVALGNGAVSFHVDPTRSAKAAAKLFGDAAPETILVCDRYCAYKKLARDLGGLVVLAWCWAHQRRDFIACAAGHEALAQWGQEWIERIASIYRLNDARLVHYERGLDPQTQAFAAAQHELEREVERLFADAERELASLPAGAREGKALRSLVNHREGLSVFVARAWVPMDNNAAERALRGAAIGRRLSFGSNSETGARFTAVMYSIVGTLELNGIDVLRWLEAWLGACADHGGRAPHNLSAWLPWSMCEQRKRELMAPR